MSLPARETMPEHFKTDAERRAYQRGYQKRHSEWPAHKPPMPPVGIVRDLMTALSGLRDAADTICATLDPKDDFVMRLSPHIDSADWAMSAISDWLHDVPNQGDSE